MKNNWAYSFALNHTGAGVGLIYYTESYFNQQGLVNPANAQPYTQEELNAIKNNTNNITSNIPDNAYVGMNVLNTAKVFWYDYENSNAIVKSAAPLVLNAENGQMSDTEGKVIAQAM